MNKKKRVANRKHQKAKARVKRKTVERKKKKIKSS
jgi:hypothetical protein